MTSQRKISDDELVEISGGADGPHIDIDPDQLNDDAEGPRGPSEDPPSPGGPGIPPETQGTGGGGNSDPNVI